MQGPRGDSTDGRPQPLDAGDDLITCAETVPAQQKHALPYPRVASETTRACSLRAELLAPRGRLAYYPTLFFHPGPRWHGGRSTTN
jgi:hypothetical protein